MDGFQKGVGRDIFFDIFKHPLWVLSIIFFWSLKITNSSSEMKFSLIFELFLVQSFLKKIILLYQNDVWNSILNRIPTFWQWAIKLSSSNYPISFEGLWRTIDFIIKRISPPSILTKCLWRNIITLPLKIFLMVDGLWTFWLILDILFFSVNLLI